MRNSTIKALPFAEKLAKVKAAQARQREKRLAKWKAAKGSPRTFAKPLPKSNPKRQARRLKAYRTALASPRWKALKLEAYYRDNGLCQCPDCIEGRKMGVADAFEPIEVWFSKGSKVPKGFHSHHTSYVRFGAELLSDILTLRPSCHMRLEAKSGMRKRFLSGGK